MLLWSIYNFMYGLVEVSQEPRGSKNVSALNILFCAQLFFIVLTTWKLNIECESFDIWSRFSGKLFLECDGLHYMPPAILTVLATILKVRIA